MGNGISTSACSHGFEAWEQLNEDTMLVLLKYLTVFDYVQLTLACRKFLYFLLGPNNYFWAQLCDNLLKDEEKPSDLSNGEWLGMGPPDTSPTVLRSRPKSANELLRYVQNGRKFIVDGKPVDLNRKINTMNKHFVSHFNFKEEIKAYFFEAVLRVNLEAQIRKLVRSYLQLVRVDLDRQPDLKNLWTKLDNISHHYNLDYSFVVDVGADPMELGAVDLPYTYKNRLVWYVRCESERRNTQPTISYAPTQQELFPKTDKNSNLVRHPDVFQLPKLTPGNQPSNSTSLPSLSSLGYYLPPNFN